jgi:phenylacetate-CoA ligase
MYLPQIASAEVALSLYALFAGARACSIIANEGNHAESGATMQDSSFRRIYRRMTSPRGRRVLHAYQDMLLRRQIVYTATNSPYYRTKFLELGLKPQAIRRAADLPSLGFFTYPGELRADPFAFLAIPRNQIVYAIPSSGTTGKSKIVFFSKQDWATIIGTVSVGLALMDVTSDDVGQILFAYGEASWPTGMIVQMGLERLGAFSLPAGNAVPIEQQIEMMRLFGATMLFSTPSYLYRLTEEARRSCDLRSLGVRLIRLGSEPWSEELRAHLQQAWGAQVYDAYGMIELGIAGAGECRALCGLHLSPYVLVEVVDPQTGEPVARGDLGELVYTTLNRQATPLLRYRSGDLGRLLPDEPCPCGEVPTDRMSRIVGRTDDMIFLGTGENAFPAQFEAALLDVEGLMGFQIIIRKTGYQDLLHIRAEVAAPSGQMTHTIRERLYAKLAFLEHDIERSGAIAPLEIEFLDPGTLHRESPLKVRRLVDRRLLDHGDPRSGGIWTQVTTEV